MRATKLSGNDDDEYYIEKMNKIISNDTSALSETEKGNWQHQLTMIVYLPIEDDDVNT